MSGGSHSEENNGLFEETVAGTWAPEAWFKDVAQGFFYHWDLPALWDTTVPPVAFPVHPKTEDD